MDLILTEVEVRVLGALIEKQISTPEYYPLSLNALVNACNQKSSREPVVAYDETTVMRALDSLREKKLLWSFKGADSRVVKYGHIFADAFRLHDRAVAVMCVLMLRGAQTPGEIKARTKPLYNFERVEEVETALQSLIEHDAQSLVVKLPRQPGFKEFRYAHLLSGAIDIAQIEEAYKAEAETGSRSSGLGEKVAKLQEEVEGLRGDLGELRQQFFDFKKQFE